MLKAIRELTVRTVFIFLITLLTNSVFADMIYLKNGEKIEGLIEMEDEEGVTLDIGSGTIILRSDEIDYIKRYNKKKQSDLRERWRQKYIERIDFFPGDFKRLFKQLKEIEQMREVAVEGKEERSKAREQISELEESLTKLNSELARISKSLMTAKPKANTKRYNSLVEKFNALQAEIKLTDHKKNLLTERVTKLDEKISEYVNKLSLFKTSAKKEFDIKDPSVDDQKLLAIIKERLGVINDDFKKHSIDYNQRGNAIIVEALLNERVKANFILDTGASIVVVSRRIAQELDLELGEDSPSTFVTLADGREVKANIALLDSIAVGKLEAKNVQVAVLEKEETGSEDGLLGMTFLKNFMIKIDPKSGRLVLEEFTP